MNIYDFPLYYISFKPSGKIETHYKKHGFTNVNHFEAVPGKKLSLKTLLDDGIISIQAFEDITLGRETSKGLPSKGAVGCTLSHYELWSLCSKKKYPYIIIAEEDNRIDNISSKDVASIEKTIKKPNGVFMSTELKKRKGKLHFYGTHFYIASLGACEALIGQAFPIDVQTDWYMAHMGRRNNITIEGYPVSSQNKSMFQSSIQDFCIKCYLPKGNWFYLLIAGGILILVIVSIIIYKKLRKCRKK